MGVAHPVEHEAGQVDGCTLQRAAGVEPGEQQEVLDERGHPVGLRGDAPDRVLGLRGELGAAAQLGVPADGGQGRAQLVAGVGDELPQPHLAVLACLERAADVVEHLVERGRDLPDLRARVDVADPLDELDLPAVQGQRADLRGRVGHPLERAQLPPHQHRARDARTDQRDADDDHLDEDQAVDDVLGVARGLAQDVGRAVHLPGHHAVGADREVHGRRSAEGRQGGEHGRVVRRHRRRPAAAAAHLCPLDGPVADRGPERARALGRPEEGVALREHTRRRSRELPGLDQDEPVARVRDLAVQPGEQELAQGERRRHADHGEGDGEQQEDGGDQPGTQGVRPARRLHPALVPLFIPRPA